jgi:anaerobic ribonucleoside-triphosphate reductase activating protein
VEIADLFNHIAGLKIDGVTFSGGEPFEQAKALAELAKKCRDMGLSVISYSGYTLSELKRDRAPHLGSRSLLNQLDVLIDGPFRLKLAGDLPYRGSSNQLIHLLTDRYSLDDFVSVRVEIRIDEKGIQVTGFLNPDKERSF